MKMSNDLEQARRGLAALDDLTSAIRTLRTTQPGAIPGRADMMIVQLRAWLINARAAIEEQDAIDALGSDDQEEKQDTCSLTRKAKGGSWVEVKTIKGHKYRYLRWREGGRLRSKYLGKA